MLGGTARTSSFTAAIRLTYGGKETVRVVLAEQP